MTNLRINPWGMMKENEIFSRVPVIDITCAREIITCARENIANSKKKKKSCSVTAHLARNGDNGIDNVFYY